MLLGSDGCGGATELGKGRGGGAGESKLGSGEDEGEGGGAGESKLGSGEGEGGEREGDGGERVGDGEGGSSPEQYAFGQSLQPPACLGLQQY